MTLGQIDWGEILKGLFAPTVIIAFLGIIKLVVSKWFSTPSPRDAIEKATEIYSELNNAHYRTNAARILVLDAHNCGGTISYAQPMFGTIIYEVVSDIEPRLRRFDNVRLDNGYLDILMEIIKEGKVWKYTKDLPENSYLRIANESDDIIRTCFFFIGTDKKSIKYGSISFKEDKKIDSELMDTISDLKHLLTNDFMKW